MAVSLLYRPGPHTKRASIGTARAIDAPDLHSFEILTLDASVEEAHSVEVEITQFPIETGSNISDHRIRKPKKLRMRGVISNHPLVFPLTALTMRAGPYGGKRDVEAWDKLNALLESEQLLTIITTLKTYENMVLQSISAPRDAARGESLHFTAMLEQVQLVELQTGPAPVSTQPSGSQDKTKLGNKPTPEANGSRRSLLQWGKDESGLIRGGLQVVGLE